MIRHIVLMRWKVEADVATKQSAREAIEGLGALPEVRAMRVGENVGRSPNAYDFAAVMDFDDRVAFARYLESEAHRRYVEGPARAAVASIAAIQHEW